MRCTYYALAAAALTLAQPALASSFMGIEHVNSEHSFEQVTSQLNSALEEKGLTLVASIDHAQNAANNELSLPATTTFIFGNPNVGTPMMAVPRQRRVRLAAKNGCARNGGGRSHRVECPAISCRTPSVGGVRSATR